MSYHNTIITAFCSQMQSAVFISKFIRHPEQNGVAQYWDWPSKKGARERTDMDWLKDILGDAHTEDIDKKIASYIGKNFVSKADFRAESDKVKNLEGQIAERDGQLEELKKVDTAGLQATITQLQNENKQAKAKYDSDIAAMKLDSAIDAGNLSIEFCLELIHCPIYCPLLIIFCQTLDFAFAAMLYSERKGRTHGASGT